MKTTKDINQIDYLTINKKEMVVYHKSIGKAAQKKELYTPLYRNIYK